MGESPVFWGDGADPELTRAARLAQEHFRYFWRELAWEQRRIVPACEVAAFKAPFRDDVKPGFLGRLAGGQPRTVVEQMWVGDVDFDGRTVRGVLLNEPNALRSVHEGDDVALPLEAITDWMYALQGRVYGAWSVNVLRAHMSPVERDEHDALWGLDFGDPHLIEVVPASWGLASPDEEHPMSRNMAEPYARQLAEQGAALLGPDEQGWTQLHYMALAGSLSPVRVLLEAGADPHARTPDGRTACDLAEGLGWAAVVALLEVHGA